MIKIEMAEPTVFQQSISILEKYCFESGISIKDNWYHDSINIIATLIKDIEALKRELEKLKESE